MDWGRALWRFSGLGLAAVIQTWMSSLQYRAAYYDAGIDPSLPGFRGPAIYLFWHEYIPFPFYLRSHCSVSMLLSQHRDAEILSHAAELCGFGTVRGSTGRGGVRALRDLMAIGAWTNFAITPDGPRGPRRQVAPGCLFLASKLQIPLVCIGFGYDRPWRNRRVWDQFAIPRPGSRARAVFGPPIWITRNLDRQGLEGCRQYIQETLEKLTLEAELWASGQIELRPSRSLYRGFRRGRKRRQATAEKV